MADFDHPYLDPKDQPTPTGPGFSPLSLIGSLLTFAAAAAASTKLLTSGSKKLAGFLTRRFSSSVRGNTMGAITRDFVSRKMPRVAESAIVSDLRLGNASYRAWTKEWAQRNRAFKDIAFLDASARTAKFKVGRSTRHHFTSTLQQTSEFFNRPGFRHRAIGLAAKTAKLSAQGSLGAYIAEQVIIAPGQTGEHASPAWYNLPGHIVNYAKFTATLAPFAVAFGGGLRFGAKLAQEAGIGGLRLGLQTISTQKQRERAVEGVGQGVKWLMDGLAGVEGAMRGAFVRAESTIPHALGTLPFAKHALNPGNYFGDSGAFSNAWLGMKRGWINARKGKKTAGALQFDKEVQQNAAFSVRIKDKAQRESFQRSYYAQTGGTRNTAVEYILGLRRETRFSESFKGLADQELAKIDRFRTGAGAEAAKLRSAFKETSEYLGKMGIQAQPGVYRGLRGQSIDVRHLGFGNLRNNLAAFTERLGFRIPGQEFFGFKDKIKPLNFFLIPDLLRKTTYGDFKTGTVFLGKNQTIPTAANDLALFGAESAGATGGLVKQGLYSLNASKNVDMMGIYSGGRFWHFSNGKIYPLHSPRVQYKLFQKGSWGLMTDVMAWMSGHYPLTRPGANAAASGSQGFLSQMAFKLDLGASMEEGVISRLKHAFGKYAWRDGANGTAVPVNPLHLRKNIMAWENGVPGTDVGPGNVSHGLAMLRGLNQLLQRNVDDVSLLRNRDILERNLNRRLIENTDDFNIVLDNVRRSWASGSSETMNPFVRMIGNKWNVPKLLQEATDIGTDYNKLGRLMTQSTNNNKDVRGTFLDFITLDNLSRGAKGHASGREMEKLSETLLRKGSMNEHQARQIRLLGLGLQIGDEASLLAGYLAKGNQKDVIGRMRDIVSTIKGKQISDDLQISADKLAANPFKNFIVTENTPFVKQFADFDPVEQRFTASPFTAVPWRTSGTMSRKEIRDLALARQGRPDPTPLNIAGQPIGKKTILWAAAVRRFSRLLGSDFGVGLDPRRYPGGGAWESFGGPGTQMLIHGVVGRRVLPLAGAALAYETLDRTLDVMPGLQGTPLGEGLTVGLADQLVKARFGAAFMSDVTGITSGAKYLEGLFPGMIDSPLMRTARGVVAPIWIANKIGFKSGRAGKSMIWGSLAGLALGGSQGFGTFDLTKTTAELKEIYSGREEVPVRRGRWWELSSSKFEGQRIKNFSPNWYARLNAQYRSTPDGLGSPLEQMLYKPWPLLDFNPIGFLLGERYHYAKQHYFSRPYPLTNTAFREMPFIGPAMAATIGRVIAPPKRMHDEELFAQLDRYGYNTEGGHTQARGFVPGTSERARTFPVSPHGVRQTINRQLDIVQNTVGLWGFGLQTATDSLLGFEQPFQGDNVFETADEITSMRRSYYDLELGGLMGFSELWRRFLPKRQRKINRVNPLMNRMPKWLPVQYRVGDAYAQTPQGELLLPGQGYSAARDVHMTYPVAAEILGLSVDDTVRKMLSLGRPDPIGRDELERWNSRAKAASEIYEPYNDISGAFDGIIRKGRTKILQKIKNLNSQDMTDMIGPTETDISEVNFYMRMAGVAEGVLQYRIDGVPLLTYPVRYDEQRFQKDIDVITQARRKAADMHARGVGFEGEAYSHLDRAHVLSNVAPWSNEFKREFSMAKSEVKIGRGDQEQLNKIKKQRDAIMQSQQLYPKRFAWNQLMTPDVTYNLMSQNQNIKAAANYSLPERILGGLWEGLNSFNHPFDKFHSYKSPLEAYKATTLYGRNIKMWQSPFEHWADAYARGFSSKDDPMTGALAGFIGGYAFGPLNGPASAMLGAGVGAAYGTVHGIYRAYTGDQYIPGTVQAQRKVGRYFDQLQYQKSLMLYEQTGHEDYLEEARATMTGLIPTDLSRKSWSRFYRATPYIEKPFVIPFLKEQDPLERKEILQSVSPDVGNVLRIKWAKMDGLRSDADTSHRSLQPSPPPDWAGWSPEVNLDDVELKTVVNQGFDAHDFGLGWSDQMRRIRNSPNIPGPIDMAAPVRPSGRGGSAPLLNQAAVKQMIERTLQGAGLSAFITVTPSYHDNVLTVIG